MGEQDALFLQVAQQLGLLGEAHVQWVERNLPAYRRKHPEAAAADLLVAKEVLTEQHVEQVWQSVETSGGAPYEQQEDSVEEAPPPPLVTGSPPPAPPPQAVPAPPAMPAPPAAVVAAPPQLEFHPGPVVPAEAEDIDDDTLVTVAEQAQALAAQGVSEDAEIGHGMRPGFEEPLVWVCYFRNQFPGAVPGSFTAYFFTHEWVLRYDSSSGNTMIYLPDGYQLEVQCVAPTPQMMGSVTLTFWAVDEQGRLLPPLVHSSSYTSNSLGERAAHTIWQSFQGWRERNPWLTSAEAAPAPAPHQPPPHQPPPPMQAAPPAIPNRARGVAASHDHDDDAEAEADAPPASPRGAAVSRMRPGARGVAAGQGQRGARGVGAQGRMRARPSAANGRDGEEPRSGAAAARKKAAASPAGAMKKKKKKKRPAPNAAEADAAVGGAQRVKKKKKKKRRPGEEVGAGAGDVRKRRGVGGAQEQGPSKKKKKRRPGDAAAAGAASGGGGLKKKKKKKKAVGRAAGEHQRLVPPGHSKKRPQPRQATQPEEVAATYDVDEPEVIDASDVEVVAVDEAAAEVQDPVEVPAAPVAPPPEAVAVAPAAEAVPVAEEEGYSYDDDEYDEFEEVGDDEEEDDVEFADGEEDGEEQEEEGVEYFYDEDEEYEEEFEDDDDDGIEEVADVEPIAEEDSASQGPGSADSPSWDDLDDLDDDGGVDFNYDPERN